MKKTVIFGATPDRSRYAYLAAQMLLSYNHEIVPVSIKAGDVFGHEILNLKKRPHIPDVDTITLYVGSRHLPEWHDYLLSLNPKRIIFNPGTEDDVLFQKARQKGIEAVEGCTLVMLRSGMF